MIRRICLAAICSLGMVAQTGSGQIQYALRPLSVQSAGRDMKVGLNNHGQVAGQPTGLLTFAWLWDDGTLVQLGALGTGEGSAATDINDLGHVVGSSAFLAGNTTGHAFFYANGVMHDLTVISGLSVAQNSADSINSNSVVAGFAIGNDPFIDGKPGLLWFVDPADPTNNTSIASFATLAKPLAINDQGDVAGATLQFEEALLREAAGSLFQLGQLPGSTWWRSWARDISSSRVAVGGGSFLPLTTHAARWDKMGGAYQITDLHLAVTNLYPTAHSSDAKAVNDFDQIVGWFAVGSDDTAVMWDPTNGVVNLYEELIDAKGWVDLRTAHDINERGQILVTGRAPSGQDELALLTPVPQPRLTIAATNIPPGTLTIRIAPTSADLDYRMSGSTAVNAWQWYGSQLAGVDTEMLVQVTNDVPGRAYRCDVLLP